jgi:Uma2 family endonuclease
MPQGPPYYQLIEGNLIISSSHAFDHQQVLGRLLSRIGNYVEQHHLGELVLGPSDVFLDEINVFQPDLYFVRNENRRIIVKEGVRGAPDLVVEVLSPSNFEQDRNEKQQVYARSGVEEMWIIDPEARQIELYPLAKGLDAAPLIVREPDSFSPALFPGLTIETTLLFKPLI